MLYKGSVKSAHIIIMIGLPTQAAVPTDHTRCHLMQLLYIYIYIEHGICIQHGTTYICTYTKQLSLNHLSWRLSWGTNESRRQTTSSKWLPLLGRWSGKLSLHSWRSDILFSISKQITRIMVLYNTGWQWWGKKLCQLS